MKNDVLYSAIIVSFIIGCATIAWLSFTSIPCYPVDTYQIGNMKVPTDVYNSVNKWAVHYKVDTELLLALGCQESSWNQNCMGSAGEVGVFQIMMGTVQMYNAGKSTSEALTRYKLDDNCRLGAWYFSRKLTEFKGDWVKAIASYNCGNSNIDWWWEIKITRMHVTKVFIYYDRLCGDNI